MRLKKYLAALLAVAVAGVPVAWAAGMFQTLPIIGGAAYCASSIGVGPVQGGITGTGAGVAGANVTTGTTICGQTVPAGPPTFAGTEVVPMDLYAPGTAQQVGGPTMAVAPIGSILGIGTRNALVGGDFATNLWQRGTTFSAITPSSATMTADRFYAFSTGNTVTITKQTGAADTIPAAGLLGSMRVNRPSGSNVTPICVGQVLDAKAAARFLGNAAALSFSAQNQGTGFTAVGGVVTATIRYYTAADSATPGTNTGTYAGGSITGLTTVATLAAATTTTWQRFSLSGAVPLTNPVGGAAVTGVGVDFCMTNVGTGTANDWFEIAGVQLEAGIGPSVAVTPFERRPQALESTLAQYYTTGGGLGAETNGTFYQAGGCVASGNANFGIIFPVPMRVAPTAATSTLTAGGYSIQTAAAVTAIGTITFATSTVYNLTLNSNAACTSTLPYQLKGTNTTGLLLFSAEP